RLEAAVHQAFEEALTQEPVTAPTLLTKDNRRGRQETRCYMAVPVPQPVPEFAAWPTVKSLVMVTREHVDSQGKVQTGTRYYISSLPPKVKVLAEAVRSHWKVENELHWVLDVTFREDRNRSRA